MKKIIHETIGWYGVVAIILAYFLLSFSLTSSNSLFYQLLNLTGAIGIVIDAYFQKNYQPVILNIVWAIIAIFSLIKIL